MTVRYKESFVNTSFGDAERELENACELQRRHGHTIDAVTEYLGSFGDVAGYKVVSHTED